MLRTIKVGNAGRLRSAYSAENVGEGNYVSKINLRRVMDKEERREGWTLFRPNTALTAGPQALNVAGVKRLAEVVRPNQERTVIAATATTIYRYTYSTGVWTTIGTGFSANGGPWQTVEINGTIVLNNQVDLPQWFRVENASVTPMYELRENGVARVGQIAECNGFLCLADITYIPQETIHLVLDGVDPWGIPPVEYTQRVPYDFLWSEFGQPTRFAPKFTVTMSAASTTITLPWATQSLKTGDKVAVINGGPANGVLGGQTGYEDGIPITVAGDVVTLAVTTATGIGYPRQVVIMRWTDQSTNVGKRSIQGDGSPIIAMRKIDKLLCMYRTTGIYTARYTGIKDAPWTVDERKGKEVPLIHSVVADFGGDVHIYPGISLDAATGEERGQFFQFNGTEAPTIFEPLNDCANLWFDGLTDLGACFAVDNPVTKEVWFCRPGLVLAVSYEERNKTVSVIDATIPAAAFVHRPGSNDRQFILVDGSEVCTYGGTYLRKGVAAGQPRILGALHSFGDEHNEKDLTSYVPILASSSPSVQVQVKLYTARNPQVAPTLVCTADLTDPSIDNTIHCFFRSIYFQDEIIVTDTRDINFKLSTRLIEVTGGVQSRSSQRNA